MKQAFALIVIQEIIVPLKKHNKTIALQSKTHDWFHYETQLLGRNWLNTADFRCLFLEKKNHS